MAGLLDGLQFDPSNYGGQNGGILAMIQAAAAQNAAYQPNNSPSPFVPNDPNPQPSPLDTAQWPAGPIGAPSQANAQAPAAPVFAKPPVVAQDDDEEDAPAAPNAPASPIPVGGVQMPRIGAASAFAPNPAALPANSQPTQGQLPAAPNLPPPSPGVGDKLMTAYQNLHHGGGLIGSIVAGITGQRNDPSGVAKQQAAQVANVTARALINKGVPQDVAIAAVQPGNGEFLKTLVTQTFGQAAHTQETDKDGNVWDVNKQTGQRTIALAAPKDNFELKTVKGPLGDESVIKYNKSTGDVSPASVGTSAPGAATMGSVLAPGMTYDPNKSGPEYLAQFGPEVQAAAKAYMNGDVMPTGNARNQSIATFAKTVAQKYGQDMGIPVNDSTYSGKRKMQTDLASSSNSSMGGILSNGESSFSHLAEATKSMSDLGNVSHDFPLGGALAHVQNYIGNAGGGSDTAAKIGATIDNLGKYGAESTKFYAGTGGGVEERTAARKDVDPNKVSGEEMAAFAEKEKGLMLDRLNTKFQQIKDTFGEDQGNAIIAKHMPQIQKNIATIDANVARMRGAAPSAASKPAVVTQNGHTYNLQPDGSYK